jgi:hypothetical protein
MNVSLDDLHKEINKESVESIKKPILINKDVKASKSVKRASRRDNVDLREIMPTGSRNATTIPDYERHTGISVETGLPIKKKSTAMERESKREVLDHISEDSVNIGGQRFTRDKRLLNHNIQKNLDVPEEMKEDAIEYRWVNDEGGRVDRLRALGYEVLDSKTLGGGKHTVDRRVGSKKSGEDQMAYLMGIPKEWYVERQARLEKERQAKLRHGLEKGSTKDGGSLTDDDNFFMGDSRVTESS